MSIASRVRAFEEAAAASERYQKPLSPRTSLTFSSDDGLTATSSSSAPASPVANSVLEDLDSFVLTGTPSSSSPSPTSFSPASAHTKSTPSKFPLISFASPSPPRPSPSIMPIAKREQNGMGIGGPTSAAAMMPPLSPRRQASTSSLHATSLINNNSNVGIPALPPRSPKPPSFNGLASSDSLTIDQPFTIISSSKPSSSYVPRHTHASSTSSFHSLSLSDGGDRDAQQEEPGLGKPAHQRSGPYGGVGMGGAGMVARKAAPPIPDRPSRHTSYTSTTPSAPLAADAATGTVGPPPIPRKPVSITSSPSPQPPYQVRRQAPPAPPRPSNSTATSNSRKPALPLLDLTSSTSSLTSMTSPSHQQNLGTRRRTPVPLPARLRYEELFDHERKLPSSLALSSSSSAGGASRRTHTGWRGTSIDLRTNPSTDAASSGSVSTETERLHGQVVRRIWLCSKLDKNVLRDIWSECDPSKTGSLNRQAFVQGMWRIDEELAKRGLAAASRRKTPVPRTPQIPYAVRR